MKSYAQHIRGKVYIRRNAPKGKSTVYMAVINTHTGAVIAKDDAGFGMRQDGVHSFPDMVTHCAEVVDAARIAWMHGFGRKGLLK